MYIKNLKFRIMFTYHMVSRIGYSFRNFQMAWENSELWVEDFGITDYGPEDSVLEELSNWE